jgi:hypothetical protein
VPLEAVVPDPHAEKMRPRPPEDWLGFQPTPPTILNAFIDQLADGGPYRGAQRKPHRFVAGTAEFDVQDRRRQDLCFMHVRL